MGWFSSSKKKNKSPSWNIIDPPTAYTSPPPLPHRPATAHRPPPPAQQYPAPAPPSRPYPQQQLTYPYGNAQASYSQPALAPRRQSEPPPPRLGMGRWADSMLNLADATVRDAYSDVSARLDDVMTRIDREAVSATEAGLFFCRGDDAAEPEEATSARSNCTPTPSCH
ncbi:hypothetical protein NLG97_g3593 [Lecanicillium saksenae]|uniref:Uncharacterized protein n=1 Tax=Lecanicillium saksenae TaxID=468837 RepID=A0ACC1QXV3_9HYPO|nr:hypothetical protein NLG97_g3593 [Lecanicillium saksenae]